MAVQRTVQSTRDSPRSTQLHQKGLFIDQGQPKVNTTFQSTNTSAPERTVQSTRDSLVTEMPVTASLNEHTTHLFDCESTI